VFHADVPPVGFVESTDQYRPSPRQSVTEAHDIADRSPAEVPADVHESPLRGDVEVTTDPLTPTAAHRPGTHDIAPTTCPIPVIAQAAAPPVGFVEVTI
jgi:hypothetical protein